MGMDGGPRPWQVNEGNHEGEVQSQRCFQIFGRSRQMNDDVFNSTGLFIIRSGYLAPVVDEQALPHPLETTKDPSKCCMDCDLKPGTRAELRLSRRK